MRVWARHVKAGSEDTPRRVGDWPPRRKGPAQQSPPWQSCCPGAAHTHAAAAASPASVTVRIILPKSELYE